MNKSSQRGNITLILLFAVLLVGVTAGAYFYGKGGPKLSTKQPASPGAQVSQATPTPDETASWKTFTGGYFTIKIPPSWNGSKQVNGEYIIGSGKNGRSETVIMKSDSKDEAEANQNSLRFFDQTPKTRTFKIGGASATEYYGCAGIEGCVNEYVVVVNNNNKLYNLMFTPYETEDTHLYELMISTLKFTN